MLSIFMKKRSYQQNCSLAYAIDLIGERWTFLLIRELLIQPCRFKDLNLWLGGMGSNLLTNRLRELELDGIVKKQSVDNKRAPYILTDLGKQLESVVLPMVRWGYAAAERNPAYIHFDHWDLLAMKSFFKPIKLSKTITLQFKCESLTAWVCVTSEKFEFGIGEIEKYDELIQSNIIDLQSAIADGKYQSNRNVKQFISTFELPIKKVE